MRAVDCDGGEKMKWNGWRIMWVYQTQKRNEVGGAKNEDGSECRNEVHIGWSAWGRSRMECWSLHYFVLTVCLTCMMWNWLHLICKDYDVF